MVLKVWQIQLFPSNDSDFQVTQIYVSLCVGQAFEGDILFPSYSLTAHFLSC